MSTNEPAGTLRPPSPPARRSEPLVRDRHRARRGRDALLRGGLHRGLLSAARLLASRIRASPGVLVPALAGGLLVIGAVLLHVVLGRGADPRRIRFPLLGVLGTGAAFLATQAAWLHVLFWYRDIRIPDSGVFASALYGLSAVQAAHLAVVLVGGCCAWDSASCVAWRRVLPLRRALPGWWCSTVMYGVLFAVVYPP